MPAITMDPRRDIINDPLYVVTAISNPIRYKTRWALYEHFEKHMRDSGVILYTAELAYGDRAHAVTDNSNPRHLQFRTDHELWHKENLLNLAIQRLPSDWKYVAWIDADVTFTKPTWASDTIHALQHYDVVQLWSQCQDLFHDHSVVNDASGGEYLPGMVYQEFVGRRFGKGPYAKHPGHCGYAWAIRRDAFDKIGGLIDWSVCGANDHHMARGFLDNVINSVHPDSSSPFKDSLGVWGERAKLLRRNIGYIPGLILHHWHGPKSGRGYQWRWQILIETGFNPYTDLKKDWAGVYQLVDHGDERSILLRDRLRFYFRQRNEDSIDWPDD